MEDKINEILQWVEFDVILYVSVSSTSEDSSSLEVIPKVEKEYVFIDVLQ